MATLGLASYAPPTQLNQSPWAPISILPQVWFSVASLTSPVNIITTKLLSSHSVSRTRERHLHQGNSRVAQTGSEDSLWKLGNKSQVRRRSKSLIATVPKGITPKILRAGSGCIGDLRHVLWQSWEIAVKPVNTSLYLSTAVLMT